MNRLQVQFNIEIPDTFEGQPIPDKTSFLETYLEAVVPTHMNAFCRVFAKESGCTKVTDIKITEV